MTLRSFTRAFSLKDFSVFILTIVLYLTAGIPGFNFFYYTLIFVILINVVDLVFYRKALLKARMRFFYLPVIAFIAFSFLSLTWVSDFTRGFARFLHIAVAGIFFLIMLHLLSSRSSMISLKFGVFFGSVFLISTSIFEYLRNPHLLRIAGLAGNANTLNLLLMVSALVIMNPSTIVYPYAWIYAFFILAYGTIVSGSRKALIIWPIMVLFLMINVGKTRTKKFLILTILVTVLILIMLLIFGNVVLENLLRIVAVERFVDALNGNEASAIIRSVMAREGIELWKLRPLIGFGPDQFSLYSNFRTYSHNNYIELLSTSGLIGLITYYLIYFIIFNRALNSKNNKLKHYILMSIIFLFVTDLFFVSYYEKYWWLFLSSLLASTIFDLS